MVDAASKSRTEISAANHLRTLYDLLLRDPLKDLERVPTPASPLSRPQSARASKPQAAGSVTLGVDAIRSLRRQRSSRQHREHQNGPAVGTPTAKSSPTSNYTRKSRSSPPDAASFVAWIDLSTTILALEVDRSELEREIRVNGLKCAELQEQQLPTDADDLDPKLQCLEAVLGERDFRRYLHDLSRETAAFRRHFALYHRRLQRLQQSIWEAHDKCVTRDECLDLLNTVVSVASSSSSDHSPPEQAGEVVVLLSRYPVLFHHCLDTRDADRVVLSELLALLAALPANREALLRRVFEQISDARRGEGAKPPPDVVRPHKLMALAKQSLANGLSSRDEFDEVASWLTSPPTLDGDVAGVSLRSFLAFHLFKSDAFSAEDAEFVTYLMRMWSFQIASVASGCSSIASSNAVALAGEDYSIAHVLKSYELRCQLTAASARKSELVAKIQHALENHVSKHQALEDQVRAIQTLQLNNAPLWRSIQGDQRLAAQCASSLTLLKVLVLSGQCLQEFPAFVTNLKQLEVLDLSDNLLPALPLEIAQLQELQALVLSFNRLTEKSFQPLEAPFAELSALRELQLRNNQLAVLPRAITAIPSLTALDLSENALRSLPSAVLQLWEGACQLVTLDLHHNALTALPEEMAVMRATLQHLFVHENKLATLPASISLMPLLETLTLSRNSLGTDFQSYPVTIEQRRVLLDHNHLRSFPMMQHAVKWYLEGTPSKIVSVNASWNRLSSVPAEIFANSVLSVCEELELHHNSLHDLPEELFRALPALRVCRLSCNRLTRLPNSLAACRSLCVLDVQQNRITALSPDLVRLERLVVLNATENELADIPSEWHAFASFCDTEGTGDRTLRTLALKKNPIQNKVLKTLVDGGSVDVSAAAVASFRPSDETVSECVVKKVVDALHTSIDVLAMETEGVGGGDDDRDEFDAAETNSRVRWKGLTRNVNRYLERKLRSIHAAEAPHRSSVDSASSTIERELQVSARAFQRLIRSLPSTCSQQEMASLAAHFRTSERDATVSGYRFLLAIDQFGQRRTLLAAPAPANSSFAVSKPGDPVASILYYLSIVHAQQELKQRQKQAESPQKKTSAELAASSFIHRNKLNIGQRATTERARGANTSPPTTQQQQQRSRDVLRKHVADRETQAKEQFLQRHLAPEHEVLMRRQKQRIAILEQQLMDQKLLQVNQSSRQRKSSVREGELAPSSAFGERGDEGSDEDSSEGDDEAARCELTKSDDSSVLVCVKCAKGQEDLPQMQRWKSGKPLCFSISVDAPVSAVKQRIECETQIPVANQVLVAPRATSAGSSAPPAVRVRNSACVKEYLELATTASKTRWTVTLLFSESLR